MLLTIRGPAVTQATVVKLYTVCKTQDPKVHTLFSGKGPFGPNKSVPRPFPGGKTEPILSRQKKFRD